MSENPAYELISRQISENPVMLYMKGSPVFPQCGFSATVIEILTLLDVKFHSFDVLSDPAIRDGIEGFSDWPTIPQLYVQGEFIGGCDILREMYETGELKALFADKALAASAGSGGVS